MISMPTKTAKPSSKNIKKLPLRAAVKEADTWDLSSLFANDAAWEKAFKAWEGKLTGYQPFRGRLGDSAKQLASCLKFDSEMDRAGERLGNYAFLKTAEDQANSTYQRMLGRYRGAAGRAAEAASFIRPELMAIKPTVMKQLLADRQLAPYRLQLERVLRYRPHTLGDKEERLLAMQSEMSETSNQVFRQLNDADLKWPAIKNEQGELVELSTATFSMFQHSPKRSVRKQAFHEFYKQYDAHQHTLAATLSGSVQRDVYYARAREFPSALESALFADNVPISVYDNLIASVRRRLPCVHRFYDLRRRLMKLDEIHIYDTYVPILSELEVKHTWQQACKAIMTALEPLGSDYCGTLEKGLAGRWCDRYPNQGKQSGAFSSGGFDGDPFILMNYQPQVLDHVFTLAHEAGHSMHSYYSAKSQPYEYYNYTIFVAEVASTFNEQLLSRYLLDRAKSDQERAYLINREIDGIRATIVRQTMFAEFERITHALVESHEPLTIDRFKTEYRKLLDAYFGPNFVLDDELSLECLRIPHFYRAFYVYKYATGLSAAIALADRVLGGGKQELNDYLSFLKGGCSKWPLDLLRDAGVDMEKPAPVDAALTRFDSLVSELDALL
jgi:oligoendopeptidase F